MLCLDSVQKAIAKLDAEVIVVDNNSQDESAAMVSENFPEVKLIENSVNSGFSKGNNLGVAQAKGKYICLLNPDTVVGEQCFKNFLTYARLSKDLGALGPRLIDGLGEFLPESKRNVPVPLIAFKKIIGIKKGYYSPVHFAKHGEVEVLVGAFMFMRKDRYLEVGGLDEDYFMYGEDIDLSYKFLKAGYQNYYLGTERVLHFKGESSPKDEVYRQRFFGAMHIFYQKHFKNSLAWLVKPTLKLAGFLYGLKPDSKEKKSTIKQVLLIGATPGLQREMGKKFDIPIHAADKKLVMKKAFGYSLFVLNAEKLTYEEILYLMNTQKNKYNNFRIKPTGFSFVLGSDSSTTQGQMIKF